jgi:serine protease Do
MASRSELVLCIAWVLLACPSSVFADKLHITSTPPGATVELDGVVVGTTPFEKDFPGGYFHKPKTALSSHLDHPVVARISLSGYATKELTLTVGPTNWHSLSGRVQWEYWHFKSDHFPVELLRISETFTGGITAEVSHGGVGLQPELSLEELVRQTKPAVVYLKGLDKSGSGFFVTGTGVIVTNAHLARGEETLLTLLSNGQQLEAKVVHVDPDLDIALAKVDATLAKGEFRHLTLADASTVHQGESVLAIGNPGDAMLFSVTKGIVSAVGTFPSAGPGTWIQTDTPINPGNSGGPLLNSRGEVIGINTQKLIKKNVTGIGFALSASDLLNVLHRFYPNTVPLTEQLSAPVRPAESISALTSVEGFGTVILNEPKGAEIWLDHAFIGNVPAKLNLTAVQHLIVIRVRGHADWIRPITVQKDSEVTLEPELP